MQKRNSGISEIICFALLMVSVIWPALVRAQSAQPFPTYTLEAQHSLNSQFTSDIAGSAFVDLQGNFHWLDGENTYNTTDDGTAWNRTFTNTDIGAMNGNLSNTTLVQADSFYGTLNTVCYKIDQRATNPVISPYEDDHCDLVGTWVDPSDGSWYAVVNDEYDFAPFNTTDTVTQRVSTGVHSNRIMAARSTDNGQSWVLIDEIITSPYQDNDAADTTAFPGNTWSYGVAGCRLFVDHATGYFYVVYNNSIKMNHGYSTFQTWPAIARAPISGKMAKGTWNKYYNGGWTQPGAGGLDGNIGDPLNLVVSYNPAADLVEFKGTGADGSSLDIQSIELPSTGIFTFSDANGATYTGDAIHSTITSSTYGSVSSVSYLDKALNANVSIAPSGGKLVLTVTDAKTLIPVTNTLAAGYPIFEDTTTHRLYLQHGTINETAFTFNTFTGKYRGIGYDTYVYENFDMGQPNIWQPIGVEPSGASNSYLTSLDLGSLTNQYVSSRSYRMISDLSGSEWDITMGPHTGSQTMFGTEASYYDSEGNAIDNSSTYTLSIGGTALSSDNTKNSSGANQWNLISVPDPYNSAYPSGFFKIENVYNGEFLDAEGLTVAAQRAVGTTVNVDPEQNNYEASGNSSNGQPGGSDQWYLLPIGKDVPATLDANSSAQTITAATNTSLQGIKSYKIVNRNSGNVLQYVNGGWQLAGPSFGSSAQVAVISESASLQSFLLRVPVGTATVRGGGSSSYTVNVVPDSNANPVVALSLSGLPSGATYSFSPATVSGSGSSTLTISTTTAITPGSYPLTVTGNDGSSTFTAAITLTVYSTSGDYAIAVSPSAITTAGGDTSNFAVAFSTTNGYLGTVTLSATSGLPAGSTLSFSPPTVSSTNPASTLSVVTPGTIAPGSYPINITATDGTTTHTAVALLVVNSISGACISALGNYWVNGVLPTQTGTFTAEWDATPSASLVNAIIGLSLGAQTDYPLLAVSNRFNPSGSIDARNGSNFVANTNIPYTAGVKYHFRAVVNVPAGTYSIYVTPQGQSEITIGTNFAFRTEAAGTKSIDHWDATSSVGTIALCNMVIDTPDFSVVTAPSIKNVAAGNSASFTATVQPISTYSGNVNFTASGLPSGATATFTPVMVSSGASTTLQVGTNPNLSAGTYPFTITATDGTLTHSAYLALLVTAPCDTPTAASQSVNTTGGTTSNIVLAATIGANCATTDTLNYIMTSTPQHGTLTGVAPHLVYTPAAGYNGSDLFTFTVTDSAASPAISNPASIYIDVTSGTVQLITQAALAQQADGSYQATVIVTNNGTAAAPNVQLTSATLSTASGTALPASLGTLAAGGSATTTISFPASAGTAGSTVVEHLAGTYSGGTFGGSIRALLPTHP